MVADLATLLGKISVPLGVATTIIGGSAWLTTTHNRVEQVAQDLVDLKSDYRSQKDKILDRLQRNDDKLSEANAKLSGLDAKIDLLITTLRRKNADHR